MFVHFITHIQMSSSDIRDILQIGAASEPAQKKQKVAEKRPGECGWSRATRLQTYTFVLDGISRELYSLIGGAPPVAFVKPTYKAKYQTKKKATPWYGQCV